jgi:hypothetical protein
LLGTCGLADLTCCCWWASFDALLAVQMRPTLLTPANHVPMGDSAGRQVTDMGPGVTADTVKGLEAPLTADIVKVDHAIAGSCNCELHRCHTASHPFPHVCAPLMVKLSISLLLLRNVCRAFTNCLTHENCMAAYSGLDHLEGCLPLVCLTITPRSMPFPEPWPRHCRGDCEGPGARVHW